jgi:hypothetical protein
LEALSGNEITFRAFRVFIGSFELLAIREAAERSNGQKNRGQRRFLRSELAKLIGAKDGRRISRELLSLRSAGLLTFTETAICPASDPAWSSEWLGLLGKRGGKRLIPVPRQVLKFLARCSKPALAKTMIGYLLRGLALEPTGKLRTAGTVKISWICALCEVSERAARAARAELIRLGWITKDRGSFQRKLNRDGAYFVINPAWRKKCTQSAPPNKKQETPLGSKNQKPASRAEPGVCTANTEKTLGTPTLGDIRYEDLQRLSRLRVLYGQATAAKWIAHSEANFRNFIAAAARATRVKGNPVKVFVGLVRKGLWHHLTSEDENRATRALNRDRPMWAEPECGRKGRMRMVLDLAMAGAQTPERTKSGSVHTLTKATSAKSLKEERLRTTRGKGTSFLDCSPSND